MMSAPANATSRPAYRRRLHYVDRSVQRSLLIAMVVLEAVPVAASIWLVYWRLSGLIEESLYRVHLTSAGPALPILAHEGFSVLGLFAALNVLALLVAEGIWSRHENLVLHDFAALIGKTHKLDCPSAIDGRRQHEVLTLVLAWRARERTRLATIRDQVAKLEAAIAAGESVQNLRDSAHSLNRLLP